VPLPGTVELEQKSCHRVNIAPQLLKLGRRPLIRWRADNISQSFKLIHRASMRSAAAERKVYRGAAGARALRAQPAVFLVVFVSPTINRMELMRFFMETIFEWARDIIVGLSGRRVEEFFGNRAKRRRRRRRGRKSGRPP
jgi:hypothetical protein